ncbi:MAG: hypothetical protein UY89_C0037G0003 [Parcubacteria group bacterium GW2011_GWA1_54_9]|nr:MAG: hypothetical protein UY89_C0037G0003 [Parcubacteria group bacterium GW2011_GWA1_54_9]
MRLAHRKRTLARLQIEEERFRNGEHGCNIYFNGFIQTRREYAVYEYIERVRLPPAVHIRLAEAERPVANDAVIEPFVMHRDILRSLPADLHIGFLQ